MGIQEREEREKGEESLFKKIIDKIFPYLGKELNIKVHETKGTFNITQKDLLQGKLY